MVNDRAISTVVDVSLALVMISAAVVMMAVFLQDDGPTHEPMTADRTAETVAGMTVSVNYDIYDARRHSISGASIDWPDNNAAYTRSRHGTVATLLGHAAVANASYDGRRASVTGVPFEEAIDGRFRTKIAGAETNAHITAVWRPYEGSSIEGVATAGVRPPRDANTSLVTMTVPSGITLDRNLSSIYSMNDEDRAGYLAERIVAYHFPEEGTFHGLESEGFRRQVTLYRYYGFLDVTNQVDEFDHQDEGDPLNRYSANANTVSEAIATGDDNSLQEMMEPEQEDFTSQEAFADWLTVDEVEIIVRVWNT